jgi:hypothetical protein
VGVSLKTDEIADLLPHMTPEESAELELLLRSDKALWRPLPGPQFDAYHSQADITGYGGAAGGGKTDLLAGLVLTAHKRSVIFRREKAQTERIIQRLTDLLGGTDGLNSQKGIWQLPERRLLELAGLDNPGDERRWQGRDHDLKAYDEVTEMREAQVRYTMGWNRSDDPNVRSRVLMTFNPPTTAEGRWVLDFFAPWLDDKHLDPAQPGELRWFTTIGDKDLEVPGPEPFVLVDGEPSYDFDPKEHRPEEVITPRSRTFIPSRVTDNPYYMATGYIATLQGLPEPLRSQMLTGNFMAGVEDDPWQVIPTLWVDQAMARWQPRLNKQPMDSMGVDVARGGKDKTVIARRHGTWFDEPVRLQGQQTPDGPTVFGQIMAARRDEAPVHIDVIGVGSSPFDFLVTNRIQAIGVDVRKASHEVSKEGQLKFANLRAEIVWRMREALSPHAEEPIALPPDKKLRGDLTTPRWKMTGQGIRVELKEEIIARLGRSPDDGDAYCLANMTTPKRAIFSDGKPRDAGEYDPYA